MKHLSVICIICLLVVGCTQQQDNEKQNGANAQNEQQSPHKTKPPDKTSIISRMGELQFDSQSGKQISGDSVFDELVKAIQKHPKVDEVYVEFSIASKSHEPSNHTIVYNRTHGTLAVRSSFDQNNMTDEKTIEWAQKLAKDPKSMRLGLY